jgi:putative ABC transport system ATP-binding protein
MKLFGLIAQNGTAILLVTHEPDTVSYGNRVYVMNAGTLAEKN